MPINDFFTFAPRTIVLGGTSPNGVTTLTDTYFWYSPEFGVYRWRYYFVNFWGGDCELAKTAWDAVGFLGLLFGSTLALSGSQIPLWANADIDFTGVTDATWGSLSSTMGAEQTISIDPDADNLTNRWQKEFNESAPTQVKSEISQPIILGSTILGAGVSFSVKGSQDSLLNPTQIDPATLTLPSISIDEITGVSDPDGLFAYIFPECGVSPNPPTTLPIGFHFPLPGENTDFLRWSYPAMKTRLAFQNYSYAVPNFRLKGK